ncbi:hypothetical protein [Desulfothermobacter acidiphilus]|uniref:hypothetical protein n=1 Tax=Desulfothermobacter acidiphilus TaxID=1938353 RepID=UPI003F8C3C23
MPLWWNWLLIVAFFFLTLHLRTRQIAAEEFDGRPRLSPLARAILNLVGVAGGIYLALTLLVDFLGLDLPPRVNWGGVSFEPLAMIALLISLLQPWGWELYHRLRR